MRIYNYLLIVIMTLVSSCSKNDDVPVAQKLDAIDGYSIAQVDSIARHYGWTFTLGDTAKGKQTMKISDFIKLAESRLAKGLSARKMNIEGTVTLANTVIGNFSNDGNTIVGLGVQNAPLYNLTWKFPNLKDMAYPSIYNMTFSVFEQSGGSQPQVGTTDFMYDGADGPVITTDWEYRHGGATISGIASAFHVQNYGTEHETVHILGATIQRHYLVQFKIDGQSVANATTPISANILLTQLN